MAEGGFRLPGASYDDLVNIIVAYGTRDEASNPGDVRKLDAVHRSSASRTNGFLVDIGILRGEREKLVTRRGRELGLALYDRDEEEIKSLWRKVVSTSEFLQNVVSAVKMQDGVSYEAVQAYIAHAAGQPRNKPVMIGSSTIVEILKSAGFLREGEGGRIFVLHDNFPPKLLEPEAAGILSEQETAFEEGAPETPPFPEDPSFFTETPRTGDDAPETIVNIHLHINCAPEDLETLTPKLKAMISSLKEAPVDDLSFHFDRDDFLRG
ncbi:hypothetical protein [Rubrobacter indicoceani]|uniref:hypothetical protein n=1 Tax=Rubrobacter indicoceani TaxID=2051957 RepID=UPI000E5A1FA1|nr:hypothetical protein [Rubrobacter indicoceani]